MSMHELLLMEHVMTSSGQCWSLSLGYFQAKTKTVVDNRILPSTPCAWTRLRACRRLWEDATNYQAAGASHAFVVAVSFCLPLCGPVWENLTSYTKPEVHNLSQCRGPSHGHGDVHKNWWRWVMWFRRYPWGQTDTHKHTHRQTRSSQYSAPKPGRSNELASSRDWN